MNSDHRPEQPKDNLSTILHDVDRAKAFKRARRHTSLVSLLKFGLPLIAILATSVYFVTNEVKAPKGFTSEGVDFSKEGLKMKAPKYEGFDEKNGNYLVQAKFAKVNPMDMSVINLDSIQADIEQKDHNRTRLTATKGKFLKDQKFLHLFDGVEIKSTTGMHAKLKSADIDLTTKDVVTNEPMQAFLEQGAIRANSMHYKHNAKHANFKGDVKLGIILPKEEKKAGSKPAKKKNPNQPLQDFSVNRDAPLLVYADELDLPDAKKTAFFTGNIIARQDNYELRTNNMDVIYTGGMSPNSLMSASAGANTEKDKSKPTPKSAVSELHAYNGFNLVSRDGRRLQGNSVKVLVKDGRIEIEGKAGNPVLISTKSGQIKAGRGVLNTSGHRAYFEKKVLVSSSTGQIKSDELFMRAKTNYARFRGDVVLDIKPLSKKKKKQTPKAPKNTAAIGALSADSSKPIRISADQLEIFDKVKKAVFDKKVFAKQGKFSIRSNKLDVQYRGDLQPGGLGTTSKKNAAATSTQLRKITATGKVLVITPNDQTATGEKAVFDVTQNTLTMKGNVILSQGKNILKGEKLVLDLNSGKYKVYKSPKKRLEVLIVPGEKGASGLRWPANR